MVINDNLKSIGVLLNTICLMVDVRQTDNIFKESAYIVFTII